MGSKYNGILSENQTLIKRLKDREKLVEFLESEIKRRSEEFRSMTRTFEEFLEGRAKQFRKERVKRLVKLEEEAKKAEERPKTSASAVSNLSTGISGTKVVKAYVPDKIERLSAPEAANAISGQVELERGFAYLKRFKNLSKAFATGDFRIVPHGDSNAVDRNLPGPWQKV
jgi:hypothetical protein